MDGQRNPQWLVQLLSSTHGAPLMLNQEQCKKGKKSVYGQFFVFSIRFDLDVHFVHVREMKSAAK